jgi:nucleoid-associated protein YgaU
LGDKNLGNYLQEKEDDKKAATRQVAFDEYESAYKKYNESKKTATQAKEIAINSKSDLKQSAKYVENDLNTADSYMGGPNEKTRKERENLAQAYADIENGNLKSASDRIESSKSKSRALLSESIQNFARERNLTATEVVEDATARFEEIKEEDVKNDQVAKANYESSRENIGAANESLASAGNLYAQEKYEDSIRQSEEAIRLSGIVVEQTAKLTPQSLTKRNSGIENGKDSNKSDSTKISKTNKNKSSDGNNLSEGWTKYKVKNQKPEDCLWRIAESKSNYGNGKLWKRIYEANKSKIKNKNLIYPNQVLYIPPKKVLLIHLLKKMNLRKKWWNKKMKSSQKKNQLQLKEQRMLPILPKKKLNLVSL